MTPTVKKKKYTLFRPMILSRHPSHDILRLKHKKIAALPYRSVIRFGSSTEVEDSVAKSGNRIEINTVNAIKISANKLLMKQKFTEAGVRTANWRQHCPIEGLTDLEFPIVAKAHYGSKGKGNTLLKTHEEYLEWTSGKNLSKFSITRHLITCAFFLDASRFTNFDKPLSTATLYLPIL